MITWITIGIILGILAVLAINRLKSVNLSLSFDKDNQPPKKLDKPRKQLKR